MASAFTYPKARTQDLVEHIHGRSIADPYRWLEDDLGPETLAWVEAQNALTRSLLDGPARDAIRNRLTALYDYPRTGVPIARRRRYFFTHNTGLQNQGVLYVQDGLDGSRRVLLDPNTLSADGTVALTGLSINDEGTLLAYALSTGGSDRQVLLVRDVETGADRPDRIEWVKFSSVAWLHDGSGFYYTRFPEPGTVAPGDENYFNRIWFHALGDPQARDTLVYERPEDREIVFSIDLTADDRWLVITAFKGSSDKSEVWVVDRRAAGTSPQPIAGGFTAAYQLIDSVDDTLFFQSDEGAPLGRVLAVDLRGQLWPLVEIVPETGDKLSLSAIVHRTLVLSYLHDASDRLRLHGLDGAALGEIPLPGIGSVTGLSGRPEDDELFFGYTSYTSPPVIFRYDFPTAAVGLFSTATPAIDPDAYETRQVWYPSKDGTPVSMFLVHRKGLAIDGRRPVLLSGYGGFNISLTPAFDPANFVWLERGGIYAVANLRGGGEYGEAWHAAGMFERKQNVFDDFIAAAEWLVAEGITTPSRIAIEGGSNGGLLVAAVLVQRPDLVGAVVCRVPVADMLRYHLFTVGRFWISEYGSADDAAQFEYLLKYSPYHNVKDGVAYPATLIMTADTDDRVAPGMAKKLAARLQEATAGPAPILLRVERKAGHGAGKPIAKLLDEDADIFAFLESVLPVAPVSLR